MRETGKWAKQCEHYVICEQFKEAKDGRRDRRHTEFCKRLAILADVARIVRKHYNEENDAFYDEMMGQYWPTETER